MFDTQLWYTSRIEQPCICWYFAGYLSLWLTGSHYHDGITLLFITFTNATSCLKKVGRSGSRPWNDDKKKKRQKRISAGTIRRRLSRVFVDDASSPPPTIHRSPNDLLNPSLFFSQKLSYRHASRPFYLLAKGSK